MADEVVATKTFEQLAADDIGTVYYDIIQYGVRYVILRGPFALCAYLGVPHDHPLAGHDYGNIPLEVHGGLTFAGKELKGVEGDRFWYGWDYSHSGDKTFCDFPCVVGFDEKAWTVKDVREDSEFEALYNFAKLVRLAEAIARRK